MNDRLDALDAWNFVRDIRTGDWYWNPSASTSYNAHDLALIPRGEIVSLVHTKHIDYPAMGIYLRSAVGEKGWGQFVERYGIPPVIIIMPPDMGDRAEEYRAHAENVARGGCGALASGSDVKYATEARGVQPFNEFLKHQQELIVLMATGGMLTTLTEAGSGTLAGGAHADSWAEIRRMDASIIASALNRQISDAVLERAFPGRPHLAYFDFDTEATPSPSEVFEDATKARAAGYLVAQDDLEERTGYKLVKDEPAPQPGGFGAPFMNKEPAPSSTRPLADEQPTLSNPTQGESGSNAVLEAFASDTGAAAEAVKRLLENPTPDGAAALLKELPSLIPEDPALAAVIAEAMAAEFCSVPSTKACGSNEHEDVENSGHPYTKCPGCGKFMSPNGACTNCGFVEDDDRLIARGKKALESALSGNRHDVKDAMYRKGLGSIDFDLGWRGKGPGQEHGSGLLKMDEKHFIELPAAPETIVKGKITKLEDHNHPGHEDLNSVAIIHGINIAILTRKTGKNHWTLFTHFKSESGARKRIEASKKLEAPIDKGR